MKIFKLRKFAACFISIAAAALIFTASALAADEPIVLRTMGSLFYGGTVETLDNG